MGATKEMNIGMQENNIDQMQPLQEVEQQDTETIKLIKKLENKSLVLSYSSIKNLTSPVDFMNYKLKDWKPKTDSQKLGTACDLLLLTPELFEKELVVIKDSPTTDKQTDFCYSLAKKIIQNELEITEDFYESEVYVDTFKEHYSRGKPESLKNLLPYIKAIVEDKETISSDLKAKAEEICERLTSQEDFMEALSKTEERQKKIEFEFMGWKFIGYLDTYSPGIIQDLKYASDCHPDKFEYDLRKFQYDVQFGVYSLAVMAMGDPFPEYEFIVYDSKGNYSILPVDYAYIKYAQRKVEFLVNCLDMMIEKKAYFSSYNFFNPYLKIYKPKWIKGFDFEMFKK